MGTKNLEEALELLGDVKLGHFGATTDLYAILKEAKKELEAFKNALRPFAEFAKAFDAQPLRGIADEFYGIHASTKYEANLKISDCRAAQKALEE